MRLRHLVLPLLVVVALATAARGDYESHPALRPENRCEGIGPDAADCQPLFWDLRAAPRVGFRAAAAPIPSTRPPRYPGGLTDRPPPLFVDEEGNGREQPGPGRDPLCPDPDEIPWWKPVRDDDGKHVEGPDPTFGQVGPLFEVACRRGTRVRFGPWQIGRDPEVRDDIAEGVLRIESSARLDRDVEHHGLDPEKHGRREWHTGTEIYAHVATHHVVCWNPENRECNDPEDPWTASDPERCTEGYQEVADGPGEVGGPGACYAGDQDTRCRKPDETGESVREYAMYPGRTYVPFEEGMAEIFLEDQLRDCYQHLVPELPPRVAYHVGMGELDLERPVDFRRQTGGLVNTTGEPRHGVAPGKVIGGSVGEVVFQFFTEPFTASEYARHRPSTSVRKGSLVDLLERTPKPSSSNAESDE